MPTAYVLINCDTNRKEVVMSELHQLPGILEVEDIHGAYDVLIKLNQGSVEELKETIKWHLKKISDIKSTVTLIAIDQANKKTVSI
jgi:DNA-binding Lrp family transcriptional regulator